MPAPDVVCGVQMKTDIFFFKSQSTFLHVAYKTFVGVPQGVELTPLLYADVEDSFNVVRFIIVQCLQFNVR